MNIDNWENIRSQINKIIKDLPAKRKSDINDKIFKEAQKIMKIQSLSLIYDKFGNQVYEKTPDVMNYIKLQKTGFDFLIQRDNSKLIETIDERDDNNSDFIAYDDLSDVNKRDIKYNLDIDSDFEQSNQYLYLVQERKERKDKVFNDGINLIKKWINTEGQKELNKKDKDFIGFVK